MDQRTAKREACFRAAMVVESAMDGGWPSEFYPIEDECKAVTEQLLILIEELQRRGRK